MSRKKALVAGALGIVGSNLADHLHALGDWEVVGISRSSPIRAPAWRLARVDLFDAAACRALIAAEPDVTHLFYAARAPDPDAATEVAANVRMLVNLMEPLAGLAPNFAHVCLVHGTKWYGSHLGPFMTPAKEEHPRHMPPNFYLDQADYIAARQTGAHWTWSTVRPAVVCGYSLGYPHNVAAVLGAYAAISRELGLPLRFPGTSACFDAVSQVTDARLLARSMAWAATDSGCANESFNIVNGDVFRWCHLWDKLARHFDMDNGGVQTMSLVRQMEDKEALWQVMAKKHGLRQLKLTDIVNWNYADMTFRQDWDHISSTLKARRFGFHDFIDSEDMFIEQIERFRTERVIP